MDWVQRFDLFLFDLDGLLVNTEEIHFFAYIEMCRKRGFRVDWSFAKYLKIAGLDAHALKKTLYEEFPELERQEPDWKTLYAEKKEIFLTLLASRPAPLLDGVETVLLMLEKTNKKRCVVTHSQKELTSLLRKQNPILNSIPHWFTRESYSNPKPAPDGYQAAIKMLANADDHIIGFEDSQRGMDALIQTRAKPVLVNGSDNNMRSIFAERGFSTFASFEELWHCENI